MNLNDTIAMMESADFKERFKAEYYQLKLRTEGLSEMITKLKSGTLNFTPNSSCELLEGQLDSMRTYLSHLDDRACLEEIELI